MKAILTERGAHVTGHPELAWKEVDYFEFSSSKCVADVYYQGRRFARHLEFAYPDEDLKGTNAGVILVEEDQDEL